jgi:proteasome lid subunit RPN8/RPN11
MPKIQISPLAFSKIIDWTSSNTEREVGGYLIGKVEKNNVIITEATYATAESNPTFVSFDNMAQFKIIEELEKKGSKDTIVGWWHTHPGLKCFMSGTDIATQKIYQALLPEAVAMVNDGNKFARSRKQADFQAHFYQVDDNNKYHEISFDIISSPEKIIHLLTEHIQSDENIEKVIDRTVKSLASQLENMLDVFADKKLMDKTMLEAEILALKKAIAKTRADIDIVNGKLTTKEQFNEGITQIETTLIEWNDQSKQKNQKLRQQVRLQNFGVLISLVFSLLSLIGILILVIMTFLP